jgi:acetate kinase
MVTHGIWVLNPGSSSIKYEWFEFLDSKLPAIRDEQKINHAVNVEQLLTSLRPAAVFVVRVVHGGPDLFSPTIVTPENMDVLEKCRALAPLHNGLSIELLHALLKTNVKAKVIAVFDTAFFHNLPDRATQYGLPNQLTAKYGIRRFGFHGFAHDAMRAAWERGTDKHGRYRLVTIQLGSGCSMAAIVNGKPIDTTMGFTPNEGLLMSTRCGDIDAGLVTWLQRMEHWTPDETDRVLNEDSGLLGVSGISSSVGVLQDHSAPSAQEAMELFMYRIRKTLGAYYAILGGFDGVVLSGGIAENLVPFCIELLRGLEHLRIFLVKGQAWPESYLHGESLRISAPNTPVRCEIVRNSEAQVMLEAVAASGILHSA